MTEPNKEEIEKVKEIIGGDFEKEKEVVNIIYDKKQYSIRIPKKFVESTKMNTKKDKFEFTLILPPISNKDNQPKLIGRLVRK